MIKLGSFMKINKHKEFSYRPRYYNENKVRREKSERENDSRLSKDDLADRWNYNRKLQSNQSKSYFLRMFIILGMLLVLSYFLLNANLTLVESLLSK